MAEATSNSTPTTLLSIVNSLAREIDFARGIEAAVFGLECINDGQRNGVIVLISAHIEQLEAICTDLDSGRVK